MGVTKEDEDQIDLCSWLMHAVVAHQPEFFFYENGEIWVVSAALPKQCQSMCIALD